MIGLKTVELLINILTISIAYVASTTLAGFMQAWIAKVCGDDTPEQAGFLTLNPVMHVDPIGALCLFLLGLGWGRFVPLDLTNIQGRFRLFLIFLSKPVTYALFAMFALFLLLGIFGTHVLNLCLMMVLSDFISLSAFAKIYPTASSLVLAIALILAMSVYIGVMFAVLNFILNGYRFIMQAFFPHIMKPENDLLLFFAPFILFFIFARPLKVAVVYGITYIAYYLAPVLGAT